MGLIGTSQVLTRPDLEPWHCQAGRRPLRASDYSLRCGHREVLIVVGTWFVFPVFYEVPRTSTCSLDLPRPCRNRFAPSTGWTRVAVRGVAPVRAISANMVRESGVVNVYERG